MASFSGRRRLASGPPAMTRMASMPILRRQQAAIRPQNGCPFHSVVVRDQAALGTSYGTPAQVALRFTLGNRDLSTRVIGISEPSQIDEALSAVERGPLPPEAIAKLDQLWANDFFTEG